MFVFSHSGDIRNVCFRESVESMVLSLSRVQADGFHAKFGFYLVTQIPGFLVVVVILWSLLGFLNLGSIDILGKLILGCESSPVHCRVFGRIPGFYLLDGQHPPPTSHPLP